MRPNMVVMGFTQNWMDRSALMNREFIESISDAFDMVSTFCVAVHKAICNWVSVWYFSIFLTEWKKKKKYFESTRFDKKSMINFVDFSILNCFSITQLKSEKFSLFFMRFFRPLKCQIFNNFFPNLAGSRCSVMKRVSKNRDMSFGTRVEKRSD